MSALLLAAASLLAAEARSEAEAAAELKARVERAPHSVAAFIGRRANCNHFLGEEPYDEERRAFLNRTISELGCARLDRDERRLRQIYRNSPPVLRLLDETADLPGW